MSNKEFFKILESSGWNGQEKIDREIIIKEIANEGYPIFESVLMFLGHFWGVKIIFVNRQNGISDDINFSFQHATHLEVPERVNGNYNVRAHKNLCLIGSAYRDHLVLLMDDEGKMYGGYDDFLCKIGNSGMEGLEAIIYNKNFEEIP